MDTPDNQGDQPSAMDYQASLVTVDWTGCLDWMESQESPDLDLEPKGSRASMDFLEIKERQEIWELMGLKDSTEEMVWMEFRGESEKRAFPA